MHLRPETPASNPAYIYPFQNRPNNNNQFDQNQLIHNNEFIQNRPIHNNQFDQNRPISNNGFSQNVPTGNNGFSQNVPIGNNGFSQNIPTGNNGFSQNVPTGNNEFNQNQPINNNQYDEHLNNNQFEENGQNGNNQFQQQNPPEYEISPPKRPVVFPTDGLISGNVNCDNQHTTSNPFVNPNPEYVERPIDNGNEFTNGKEEPPVTNPPEVNEEENVNDKPTFAPIGNENVGLENQDNEATDENKHGIPNVPPPGFPLTTLPPLTPVPISASRNNFNFGSFGIFSNNFL